MAQFSSKRKLQALIGRYLRGKGSAEESRFVETYYDYVSERMPLASGLEEAGVRMKERIDSEIALEEAGASAVPMRSGRRAWGWVAVAASIILLGGSGVWYWMHRASPAPLAISVKPFDAPAGHAGAILTLGDGRRLTLDSLPNGYLGQQGSVSLTKRGGDVVYATASGASSEVLYNMMSTARGRTFSLRLSDGTRVWLNAASSIRFPTAFTGTERRVFISGEAYVEVAADPSKPFVVQTERLETRVLGTSFDVMDYGDEREATATLVNGAVRVGHAALETVSLSPGHQAVLALGHLGVRAVDTEPVVAWTKGELSLGGSDLAGLMRQLSRWYDVDISFQGAVPDIRIGGLLDRSVNLSVVLHYLEMKGLHYKFSGKTIVILP